MLYRKFPSFFLSLEIFSLACRLGGEMSSSMLLLRDGNKLIDYNCSCLIIVNSNWQSLFSIVTNALEAEDTEISN